MRLVVTGAGGFIGSFLTEALRARGDAVDAWTRSNVDITNSRDVARALARFKPDAVVHLAAQSLPGPSWEHPDETYRVNVGGTISLLEGVRALPRPPRIVIAGSSAEYAEPEDGMPIAEHARLEPNSPYGSSKTAALEVSALYSRRYGLDVIGFRPFAVVGPRKTSDVCSDFARRIVAIERGRERTMSTGNLEVVRDMIDVRDTVSGVIRLVDAGISGSIYNISRGQGVTIAAVLDAYLRLANTPIDVVQNPALLRPLEQKVKLGDSSKLRALGWEPLHPISETLVDILAYWRAQER
jgi:GDP-4-dehydro-6-deoxy-D-mannose reductase